MNEGMSGRLAGKIAVVTGGASGIGEGIVRPILSGGRGGFAG
jgi:NAD(P)-dependent dehydrogenase (short-subunit alcohol dehydrogenase family)